MEKNLFEERLFHAASIRKVAWKAPRMHSSSEIHIHAVSLSQKAHSSVRRAPVLNMINTLESRVDRRQHKMGWSEADRKKASPPHTHANEIGKLWRKKTRQHAGKCR